MTEELNGGCLDEREAFEAWFCKDGDYDPEWLTKSGANHALYMDADTENMWQAFQAGRASLSTSKQAGAEPVAWRYRLKGFPWQYQDIPFFAGGTPGPREEHQALTLDDLLAILSAEKDAAPGAAIAAREQEDKSFPFYELRFIMRVLDHQGSAPKEDWATAYGMAKRVFEHWHIASRDEAPATPQAESEGVTDAQIVQWAERHDIHGGVEELRAMVGDARTLENALPLTQPTTVQQAALWQWRRKSEPWTLEKTFTLPVVATTADSEVRTLYALLPPTTVQDRTWGAAALQEAHRLGFLRAAGWVQRDDLFADVNGPTYRKDRDHDLAQIKTAQTTALPGGNGEAHE